MTTAADLAVRMLRRLEGCVLHPYQDSAGYWTVGIGSRHSPSGESVRRDFPRDFTDADADAWCLAELTTTAAAVDRAVAVPLEPHERAALYSFAYNVGTSALAHSTLLTKLNRGEKPAAAAEFLPWSYAGGRVLTGLQCRRIYEAGVFLGYIDP